MLFSEPKIPQWRVRLDIRDLFMGFSALQRAENSSIVGRGQVRVVLYSVSVLFSEPKIPQSFDRESKRIGGRRFSALQRAENSSIGCS